MLRNADTFHNFELRARDGTIGHVKDLYFDDQQWGVRYLVVDTGSWLNSRKVLIATSAVKTPEWDAKLLPVDLTQEQVRNSPGIDTEKPVSRQHEAELYTYYGWTPYWTAGAFTTGMMAVPIAQDETTMSLGGTHAGGAGPIGADASSGGVRDGSTEADDAENRHLRSTREVTGYHIEATDGAIGHVEDFLIDDQTWGIRYCVIDTRNWWPGKKVVVSPQWIREVSWPAGTVFVDLSRERIRGSPEYDPAKPMNSAYSEKLHDYYQKPRYHRWD